MPVYLLHFTPAYKHAKHYCGFAKDLDGRLQRHAEGGGSNLCSVAMKSGCSWELAKVWPKSTKGFERSLKRGGGLSRHCPICIKLGTVPASRQLPVNKRRRRRRRS